MELNIPESYLQDEEREGFLVSGMMKRAWAAKLKMLCVIDEICIRHGIRWFVDYGTLLGAARHRGFVPWDDDVDISMLREDYDRALPILERELPAGYLMGVFGKTQYSVVWTRINNRERVDLGDSAAEAAITASFYGSPYKDGIDLFPMDYVPADRGERELQLELVRVVFQAVQNYEWVKENGMLAEYAEEIRSLTGQEIPADEGFRPALCRLADSLIKMYAREDSIGINSIGNMADHYIPDQWRDFSWYASTVRLPFEMIEVPAPSGYREILTNVFGANWLTPVRNASMHDYPFYKEQEEEIRRHRAARGADA